MATAGSIEYKFGYRPKHYTVK